MTVLLDVAGISVRFGGVVAVDGLSFQLSQGELLGFIGPNGAGKTTTMRVITGMVIPQQGHVSLDGKSLNALGMPQRVRLGLGLSQQITRPFVTLTALDNVALAVGGDKTRRPLLALRHWQRGAEREQARELLQRLGIADAAGFLPLTLPLGVRKRLEMARALALSPKVLLLDEPLAGLNQAEAEQLADTIAGLNREGLSIVLIEHNLREVLRICPRLLVQDQGRKLADGVSQQVITDQRVQQAYLGRSGDA